MRIDELQMGDWVLMDDITQFPMRVEGIFKDTLYLNFEENEGDIFEVGIEDVRPIPITSKVLKNNGWEVYEKQSYNEAEHFCQDFLLEVLFDWFEFNSERVHLEYRLDKKELTIWTNVEGEIETYADYLIPDVRYIHQLQQALRMAQKYDLVDNFKV